MVEREIGLKTWAEMAAAAVDRAAQDDGQADQFTRRDGYSSHVS